MNMVGVCGRNDETWPDVDFELVRKAKLQSIKPMSYLNLVAYERLHKENPELFILSRLYDSNLQNAYFNQHKVPTPEIYANIMISRISQINNVCKATHFEVHNEPNHPARYEGWGMESDQAKLFNTWYIDVVRRIKLALPWVKLGFPGLAIPHNDIEWLKICSKAVDASDFMCIHTYWQNPTSADKNHLSTDWGLRYRQYRNDKPIHITEAGNSNAQNNLPLSDASQAEELVAWFDAIKSDVVSANPFIASSPTAEWKSFTWRQENGEFKPIVHLLENRHGF